METTRVLILFVCVLSIPSCSTRTKSGRIHTFGYRIYNARSLSVGRTWDGRPCPFMGGCIKLPRSRDALTREEFENKVVGINYSVMYQINRAMFPKIYRFEQRYAVEGELVLLELRTRVEGINCIGNKRFEFANFSSSSRAILFSAANEYFPPIGAVSPTTYYMSDCPAEYVIMFGCVNSSLISHGYCNGPFHVDINLVQDPADSPPFWKIENELYRKLGLRMDDPFSTFLYIGERCPAPT